MRRILHALNVTPVRNSARAIATGPEPYPPPMPRSDSPLRGRCLCGAVRFEVTAPFETAGYCHCVHCQRRTGTTSALGAVVAAEHFELVAGAALVRSYRPEGGRPKAFCERCGGHLYSGDPERGATVGVRVGALEDDPGIRPQWHQYVASMPVWEELPDDGLPRYPAARPGK